MSFVALQERINDDGSGIESPEIICGAIGVSSEAGELLDDIKKVMFQGKPLDRSKIIDELGDVVFYVQVLCNGLDITINDVINGNIRKLKERYPNGFVTHENRSV